MACRQSATRAPQEPNKLITRRDRVDDWTGLIGFATAVHLSRGNARDTDLGAFSAPHWTVAVPDSRWRAHERLSRGHYSGGRWPPHFSRQKAKSETQQVKPDEDQVRSRFRLLRLTIIRSQSRHRPGRDVGRSRDRQL